MENFINLRTKTNIFTFNLKEIVYASYGNSIEEFEGNTSEENILTIAFKTKSPLELNINREEAEAFITKANAPF